MLNEKKSKDVKIAKLAKLQKSAKIKARKSNSVSFN